MVEILHGDLGTDGVLTLTLDDQKRRNALSEAMLNTLLLAITDAANNAQVRVVILTAIGPAFCAGHDLKELTAARVADDAGQATFARIMTLCARVMQAIVNCPKPVIAQVAGVATAAGCQLVASCDLALAGETARFATPGVNIGLFCSTPMVALSRNVNHKHAMEMLLTGHMVSAQRAAEIGLVNRAVEDSALAHETLALARTIAAKSVKTVSIGKQAFYAQAEMPLAQAYDYAANIMVENMLAHDAAEGIGAFIEKRKPNWQDA